MGDAEADFEQLFRDSYDAVFRYVARRVPRDAVQDAVSETFVTAWRRRAELRGDALPWLLGVARRITANQLRSAARRVALTDRLIAERPGGPDAEPEGHSRLAVALETLGDADREALMLTAWDGLEHRAAARVMGCSAGAFTVRLHRARRKLDTAMKAGEQNPIDIHTQARSAS